MPAHTTRGTDDTGSIRVLYVDDEPDFAALASTFLQQESEHISVVGEERAAAGLTRLENERVDCVVADYDMPEMDGLAFLVAVRDRFPDLPFILVTGRGSEELASEAISAGVTDYLQKQCGREQYAILANRIQNAVAQRRAEREANHHRRVSELVRDVTRALVGATSCEDIERAVCDRIADSDPYLFAWIGGVDDGRIHARTSAGCADGYLDEVTISAEDSPTGQGPAGTALRLGEVSVAQDVQQDPSFTPWRESALERGFRSVAGVPLVHDETTYGVLLVYAAHADAFDERERRLLAELGDAIGHAMDAIQVQNRLERQYRDLFDAAPVMYALTRNDDGSPVVTGCNQRFLDRLGYDRETVVGTPLAALYTEDSATELLDEGGYSRALDGEFVREERRLVTADGDVVETLLRAAPRYGDDGETVGTLTLFVDVTERRQARALEAQATAMEVSIDGMAIVRSDGTFEYLNQAHAALYGYDQVSDLVGESWRRLYDTDEAERFETDVLPTLRRTGHWRGEAVGRKKDGTAFPQEVSLTELDRDRFVCVVRDVTRRRETERELERRNRRLDEFALVVSHDLRNPLNVARGNLELARTRSTAPETTRRLDVADDALERMDAIIEDVLSLARGHDEVETTVVSLERTVADCWCDDDEQVTVTADVRFLADRGRLQRLFENLFRNSVEHGSTSNRTAAQSGDSVEHGSTSSRPEADDSVEHGSTGSQSARCSADSASADVELTVGPLADEPGFFVEDDGLGIPPDEREMVFEPGYTTSGSGTGLGLTIVERIAAEHDWDCRVTAGHEGGARFEFGGVDVVSEADGPVVGME